jgi:hypothetical protein
MRFNYFIAPLVLLPLCAFSQTALQSEQLIYFHKPMDKNTIVKTYTSESEEFKHINTSLRTVNYPTQIIRMTNNIEGLHVTCEQVNDEIENRIVSRFSSEQFIYNTYIGCIYDPETLFAKSFVINSYFDPISDEAIDYLKSYLNQNDGSDFLGTKLHIEAAKSLIISLSVTAGMKKNPNHPPFIEYRQDRSNYYFNNNYEMSKTLFHDVYQNFFSNDPDKILPFLDKWVFNYAGNLYKGILKDSNYVELQPERIFMMEHGEKIFVSNLKFYFGHNCNQYSNHRCLPVQA